MSRRWHGLVVAAAVSALLAVLFAICEQQGWPFLVTVLQSQLQSKSGHAVRLQAPGDYSSPAAQLHFWGGIDFKTPWLEIDAPPWSKTPYLVSAKDFEVQLRYADIWRALVGQALVVESAQADSTTVYLERLNDGRASWQLSQGKAATPLPRFHNVSVQHGQLYVHDEPLATTVDAQLTLTKEGLHAVAKGQYREDAFVLTLDSSAALLWERQTDQGASAAMQLHANIGRAALSFEGTVQDVMHLNGLRGVFQVQGPTLAAVGEPLGVTLPSTGNFKVEGKVERDGARWVVSVPGATVGASQLSGDFVFDAAATPPILKGTLKSKLLKLVDLGPAVGVTPQTGTQVLPTHAFDLAALRSMDADVQIDVDQFDTNAAILESIRPLRAHLQLTHGLLTLTDIDASAAQGHLAGTLALDGQRNRAHWVAAVRWEGVQLQHWIHQPRASGLRPYVSGRLQGHATLQGSGRSTAEILATLNGAIGATVSQGTLSHLLVEAGGLDLAESLGVYLKGDDPLLLRCAVADIDVSAGTLRPRLLVLDTSDSTLWVDGALSLATEKLDLRVVVAPKDFSVLTLRSPLHVQGNFARPDVHLEKGPLGVKLGTALLLALVNPVAALLPLMDGGNAKEANANAARCLTRLRGR